MPAVERLHSKTGSPTINAGNSSVFRSSLPTFCWRSRPLNSYFCRIAETRVIIAPKEFERNAQKIAYTRFAPKSKGFEKSGGV
jgi:hypothetical protein